MYVADCPPFILHSHQITCTGQDFDCEVDSMADLMFQNYRFPASIASVGLLCTEHYTLHSREPIGLQVVDLPVIPCQHPSHRDYHCGWISWQTKLTRLGEKSMHMQTLKLHPLIQSATVENSNILKVSDWLLWISHWDGNLLGVGECSFWHGPM